MKFILEVEDGDEREEGVAMFRHLGITLDQMAEDWTAMRRNIMRAKPVW